ncbi:M48 family metallopeptidase [Paracoccus sp. p3-h83]
MQGKTLGRFGLTLAALLALTACGVPVVVEPATDMPPATAAPGTPPPTLNAPPLDSRSAARNFVAVARRMEPQIERECLARTGGRMNCDYDIVVDDRPGQSPNAFQTRDASGRPIIGFNLPLIAEARNADEMAFVMGHEAAHHILGHLDQKERISMAGGLVAGAIASVAGAGGLAAGAAREIGSTVGARAYAKDWELQADQLGAVIAFNGGFDPERGAVFFARVPDPGDHFLGTHPSNARRVDAVREVVRQLRAGNRL